MSCVGRAGTKRQAWRIAAVILTVATLPALGGCASQSVTRYEGTYTRTWVAADGETLQESGAVALALGENGSYVIRGEAPDLPPSRSGRYMRRRGEIVLVDTAPPTAGYSLSLILTGTFQIAEDEATLILSQENTWGHSHLLIVERVR